MKRGLRIAGWLLLALIAFFSLSPASLRPVTPVGHSLEHFLVHALVGTSLGIGYSKRPWLLALSLVTFTAAIELAQLFVPGRHARLRDFLIDAGGVCVGLGLVRVGKAVRSLRSRPS